MAAEIQISTCIPFVMLNAERSKVKLISRLLQFKHHFKNGIIYSHKNANKWQQDKLGLSRNAIRSNVQKFIDKGWAERKGSLVFLKGKRDLGRLYKQTGKRRKYVQIDVTKNIVEQLRYALLKTKVEQIVHAKSGGEALSSSQKKTKVFQNQKKSLRESYVPLSGTKLGQVFGCSRSNAAIIAKKMNRSGKLRIKRAKIEFLQFCRPSEWDHRHLWWNKEELVSECFYYNGAIFRLMANQYKLVEEPCMKKLVFDLLKYAKKMTT